MDTFSLYLSVLSVRPSALCSYLACYRRFPIQIIRPVPHVQDLYYGAHLYPISADYREFV